MGVNERTDVRFRAGASARVAADWDEAPVPAAVPCSWWRPEVLADLPAIRRDFRALLDDGALGTPELGPELVEEAVAGLDELVSNAIRHGRVPVAVSVSPLEDGVLLVVTDHAPERSVHPTSTRDPAEGGMGMRLVAASARRSGWWAAGPVKHVWAVVPGRP